MATSSVASIASEFKYSTGIYSLQKSASEDVWVFDYKQNISLVDQQGRVKKKIELDQDVYGISVSPLTGNLWVSSESCKVFEIVDKIPSERFTTETSCWSLCVTQNNVVVGTQCSVAVYSQTGELLRNSERNLLTLAYHIAVCSGNGDIAVCDDDRSCWGGKDKPRVTVFDAQLELKFQYYGQPKSHNNRKFLSKFNPHGTVYDSHNRLLIADRNNGCIHLVDEYGQFLRVLYSDEPKPKALTLIKDGLMCVGFDDDMIKTITYKDD